MTIRHPFRAALLAAAVLMLPAMALAQGRGGPPPGGRGGPPPGGGPPGGARLAPKAIAPADLTGYWVSVVTEDWRYRMLTPAKGDYQGVQMTPEARRTADAWDPAAEEAAGNQCKGYGAAAIMRVPGRVHITWQDDNTLRLDTDAGTQTRLFRFGPPQSTGQPTWQGSSSAQWETLGGGRGAPPPPPPGGSLRVVTTNLRAGFVRKNGVPYSEDAVLTEYFTVAPMPSGGETLVVTSVVQDPRSFPQPFIVSSVFKKQADASGWDPTPCSATW